ncbi:MAG: N-acetylmuramoyl-L-alanine amidase [Micromonosporaceae bacterium]|nr:N-acetylmuramoyl-L-alanine amidase [Micromonosporaceae bacterium]
MARIRELAGLPIEQHDSPNVGGKMSDHRGPVLHIAEGTYRGTISWQMNPDQRYPDGTKVTTSSTWVVGKNRGEWAQMVDTDIVAWCQRSGSRTRTSIELAGHAGDKPTAWQIEACAQILAWEHRHYDVPLTVADTDAERGLGHHSMDREWAGVEWGHEDCPGNGVIAAKPQIVARAKEIVEEEDMPTAQEIAKAVWDELVNWRGTGQQGLAQQVRAGTGLWYVQADAWRAWQHAQAAEAKVDAIATQLGVDLTAVRQRLEQLADLDEAAVAQQILATLTPQAIAAAVPAELARQVADELAARLAD